MDNQETIVIRRHLDMASKKFQLMFLLLCWSWSDLGPPWHPDPSGRPTDHEKVPFGKCSSVAVYDVGLSGPGFPLKTIPGPGVVYRSGLPIQGAMGIMERRGWKR